MTVQPKPESPAVAPKGKELIWRLALDLRHVPLDEEIEVGDVYLASMDGKSYVLTCKAVIGDVIVPESGHRTLNKANVVKIKRPDHVRK